MKPNAYIWTCNFTLLSGLLFSLTISGCEIKEGTPNTDNIYKAKPLNKISVPPKEEPKKEEPKIEKPVPSLDSINIPADTTKVKKDTTETLMRQRRPTLRRYSQYNIHRRGYIT